MTNTRTHTSHYWKEIDPIVPGMKSWGCRRCLLQFSGPLDSPSPGKQFKGRILKGRLLGASERLPLCKAHAAPKRMWPEPPVWVNVSHMLEACQRGLTREWVYDYLGRAPAKGSARYDTWELQLQRLYSALQVVDFDAVALIPKIQAQLGKPGPADQTLALAERTVD